MFSWSRSSCSWSSCSNSTRFWWRASMSAMAERKVATPNRVTTERLKPAGAAIVAERRVPHETGALAKAIEEGLREGAELTKFNDFLKSYGNFDVQKGTLGVGGERAPGQHDVVPEHIG